MRIIQTAPAAHRIKGMISHRSLIALRGQLVVIEWVGRAARCGARGWMGLEQGIAAPPFFAALTVTDVVFVASDQQEGCTSTLASTAFPAISPRSLM
jgi:hypothetical protein